MGKLYKKDIFFSAAAKRTWKDVCVSELNKTQLIKATKEIVKDVRRNPSSAGRKNTQDYI